jgi:uncharacterized membrane protein
MIWQLLGPFMCWRSSCGIGGVSMVKTVLLPAARRAGAEGPALFEAIERRFARQARLATVLAGVSGFYMVQQADLWERFRSIQFWWRDWRASPK